MQGKQLVSYFIVQVRDHECLDLSNGSGWRGSLGLRDVSEKEPAEWCSIGCESWGRRRPQEGLTGVWFGQNEDRKGKASHNFVVDILNDTYLKLLEGDTGGWDGWMASPTWWTWVWVNSRSWWWTGRPGMLWLLGSQRVGHDWRMKLNLKGLETLIWESLN